MWSSGNDGSWNRCRSQGKKKSSLKDGPNNTLGVILQVPHHRGVSGARSNKRSNNRCNNGNRSTCRSGSKNATVATLSGGSASKLVFAVKRRILAKTATSRGLSHQVGCVKAFERS